MRPLRATASVLVLAVVLSTVGCPRPAETVDIASGSTTYHASPGPCRIETSTKTAVPLPDHYKTKDGKGLMFRTDGPGLAKVVCTSDGRTYPYSIQPVSRLDLELVASGPTVEVGDRVLVRLVAYGPTGDRLAIGGWSSGIDWSSSSSVSFSRDSHPLFCCSNYQANFRMDGPGRQFVAAKWQGRRARLELTVAPRK